jgi:hypothetical protein
MWISVADGGPFERVIDNAYSHFANHLFWREHVGDW